MVEARLPFQVIGDISKIETIATASGIRELARLQKYYGKGRWRQRQGIATVRRADGSRRRAEVHWYEAAGVGKREFKIKEFLL